MANVYATLNELWDRQLDGIIVTGTEPAKADLTAEPYWRSLTAVIDWADRNTHSSVWSCLAAHAALLHISGIPRLRLAEKFSGVFQYTRISQDALAERLTNGVPEPVCGCRIRGGMTSGRVGIWTNSACPAITSLHTRQSTDVDSIIKKRESLFILFQGHPEYGTDSLLLEYRRDVQRFLRGERAAYPSIPRNYFADGDTALLKAFEKRASSDRRTELLEDFPIVRPSADVPDAWRTSAARIYQNAWLMYLVRTQGGNKHEASSNRGRRQISGYRMPRRIRSAIKKVCRRCVCGILDVSGNVIRRQRGGHRMKCETIAIHGGYDSRPPQRDPWQFRSTRLLRMNSKVRIMPRRCSTLKPKGFVTPGLATPLPKCWNAASPLLRAAAGSSVRKQRTGGRQLRRT